METRTYAELVSAIDALLESEDENEDDITNKLLISLLDSKEQKIDGYAIAYTRLNAELIGQKEALETLQTRYKARIKYLENQIERLKNRLLFNFETGVMSVKNKGSKHSITFQKYPKVQLKVSVKELPTQLTKTKLTVDADLNKIKDCLLGKDTATELQTDEISWESVPVDVSEYAELLDNYRPVIR
jgi:hypothetical protein